MADIRETGPIGLKGLRGLNRQKDISEMSLEEQWKSINSIPRESYSSAPEENVGLAAMQAGYGNSQYDEGITSASQFEDIGDIRYANQPWYDTLANGLGKMLGTAGTTFVSSLVGLPYGLFQAANQGRWSALWDNDVTQGLAKADKWLEENMTNYRSQVQQNSPWYDPENLFSMNFIADDVIKNMGFTLGAAASMAVGSGSLGLMSRALGFVNNINKGTKMGQAALSALFSATGEGMIEARQGVEERNKLEMQKLEDSLMPERQALEIELQQAEQEYAANRGKTLVMGPDGRAVDPAYETYRQRMSDLQAKTAVLNQKYEVGKKQIEESGMEMGNKILLANQGLLTLGNLIQFGKGMVKSFDSARHAAEVSSKAVKPTLVGAEKLADGTYKITGKNAGRALAATKGILTEGSEEMNQQWIQSSSGASVNEVDVNDYWKAKLDPEAYRETTQGLYTVGSILDRGFQESWGDVNQWEQFVIGGLTGMAGSYTPTKIFNQDKTKSRWDPRRYGSWEGGAFNELRDFNQEYQQYQENIDDLNRILQSEDFPARIKSAVGHTYTQGEKDAAADGNDKKSWKDADDKQMIHDIQAFLRAGRLDDLRAIYDEIGKEVTPEDIQNIIKSTTKEITAGEDKQNHDRMMDAAIAEEQRKINSLYDELENPQTSLLGSIPDAYDANATYVNEQSRGILEQINAGENRIAEMNQQKQDYVGQNYYEGAYVDRDGNQIVSDDEIAQTVKHNSEELNRKLDSYLESIDYVNRRTNGALTKDQEDNLAYLHNLGKESNLRMQKIMADVRQQLPKTFLLKTSKTPEQLTQENASSNLVFTKDENTKEGYVEVDTSLMNDAAFADFFQREVMRGGNIRPEFGETAEEKAIREEEEKNLPEAEKKKKAREIASKKWQDAIQKMQDDANEQWDTNWRNLVDNFMDNYKKDNNATFDETIEAFQQVKQNLQDASALFDQAGEFQKTLIEYIANPSKVDEDRAQAEEEAQKANDEQQAKNQFAGKDASEIKQGLADGSIDFDDFDDFAGADLSDVTDEDVKAAQQEVKKAQEGNQKASALKQHIQEQLGDNPSQKELNAAQAAMQMVDTANLATDNPEDLNIAMPELNQVPLDAIDPNASIEDVDALNMSVQQMLADAFNAFEEDKNAQDDIPETVPADALEDVEAPETGHDATTKTKPEVVAPTIQSPSAAASDPLPKNPLTEGAIDTIISETSKATSQNTNGTWRSTTTRHTYGKSTGTYHESLQDKNSIQYKRSKAIWEYFNSVGAFDRQENSSADRIKPNDTVHFMVKYMGEITGSRLEEVSEENLPYSMVILMLNDNGEVIGDLPLAELEPSFRSGNPTQQVKDLMSIQKKVFDAFFENYKKTGAETAVVDSLLQLPDADNLNLTFDNSKKPLLSKVKQVMRGAVPYRKSEINTLNDVANGQPFELGVAVTDNTVAKKRGDKTQHKEIVMPHVGTSGQPYLLLPTPSGEQIAVPFYMPAFDAEKHQNTELYKQLVNAVYLLIENNSQTTQTQKDAFNKNLDVLCGLLQVKPQEGKKVIRVNNNSITLHLQSLTDDRQIFDVSVPNASGNTTQIAKDIVSNLSGIPINVSLQFLNDTIEAGGRKANYNNVIGEIADVNLPKATNHTVNGWFTVELAPSAGIKPSKKVTPRTTGVITENIEGKSIEINTDTLVAYDHTTGEIITDNEEVNLRLAQIKAAKPQYQDKDRIQVSINGELRTYDTKENKFVKTSPNNNHKDGEVVRTTTTKNGVTTTTFTTYRKTKSGEVKATTIGGVQIDPSTIDESTLNNPNSFSEIKLIELREEDNTIAGTILARKDGEWIEFGVKFKTNPITKPESSSLSSEATNLLEQPKTASQPKNQAKALEQIESEMKQKKIVGRQTKDAWDAIPDNLKLKLVNEGTTLQLSWFISNRDQTQFQNYTVTVSLSDREALIKALSAANMAAKAGNIRVSEATPKFRRVDNSGQKRANIQKEKRWLQQNLPMFSAEDRLKLIQGLIEIPGAEGWAWGRFQSGVITLSDMAAAGTTYHEAFHAVTQTLLDDEELNALYETARERYKETDVALIEELLAEDFRKYVQREETPIIGFIRKIFRRIMNAMRNLDSYRDPINLLFYKINNGEFKNTLPRVSRGDNAFYSRKPTGVFISTENPAYKAIKKEFDSLHLKSNNPSSIGKKWTLFKQRWQAKGYTPIAKYSYDVYGKDQHGYRWFGVQVNSEAAISSEVEKSTKEREYYAAKQARMGRLELFKWERLTPEQQMNLMDAGMSQKLYENISLEEKEQWVRCRA